MPNCSWANSPVNTRNPPDEGEEDAVRGGLALGGRHPTHGRGVVLDATRGATRVSGGVGRGFGGRGFAYVDDVSLATVARLLLMNLSTKKI